MRARRPFIDWCHLALLVAMWGSSFVATKVAVDLMPPATVVAGRLIIGAVVLVSVLALTGWRVRIDRRSWRWFAVMALIGNALPFFLIGWGQQRLDSNLAGILMAAMPLMTLVLAHRYVADERMTGVRLLGFCIGFGGIILLLGPDADRYLDGAPDTLAAKVAVLAGAFCYAVNAVIARWRPADPPLVAATGVTIVAALMMTPTAMVIDFPLPVSLAPPGALALAFLGVVSTALATVVYFRLIASAGPSFLSLINYFIPIWAVVLGWLTLNERPPPQALAALALVLVGITLSEHHSPKST